VAAWWERCKGSLCHHPETLTDTAQLGAGQGPGYTKQNEGYFFQ